MKKLPNIHPGEVLLEEFLIPMEISQYKLAKDLKIPQARISEIVKCSLTHMMATLQLRCILLQATFA
ncbi:MAG: HigA family addiction module antidote protein [Lewinellaceae bacterium]|nr:HigA family addiction module antidote protein [Lewinellaceae bacterium]